MPAAEQYFQVAAANIRNAILERQNEVSLRKADIAQREQDFNKQRDELAKSKLDKEQRAAARDMEEADKALLLKEAADDEKAINEAEHEFKSERERITKEIYLIEQDFGRLRNILNDLDKRAQGI